MTKKFKNAKDLKSYLKKQYTKGVYFYSNDKRTRDFLKKTGVAICYIGAGLTGAWLGSRLGPYGSVIGATVGIVSVAIATKQYVEISFYHGRFILKIEPV